MGVDAMIGQRLPLKHGGLIERMPRPVGHADEGRGLDSMEVSSVSYLSVPDTPGSRRPSTADFVIEKLQVERVDGGGLSIQGVALASNCHVTLCVFGIFFLLAGVILSYVSYSIRMEEDNPEGLEPETNKKNQKDDESSVVQMRIIGPSFLALGLLMLLLGCSLYGLARKINRDEKEKRRKISEQQVCQLQSSFSYGQANTGSPLHTATAPAAHQQYPILAVRRTSWWMDPTPIENPAPDVGEQPTSERRDSTGHAASPHGGSVNGSLPSLMSPVPPEVKPSSADTQRDIACFPPSTNPVPSSRPATATAGDPSATETSFSGSQDSSRPPTSGGPPTSAHHGRSSVEFVPSDFTYYQNTGYMVPFIQVTAPPPTGPVLPRLSRHAATRIDSRPTTADSR